MWERYCTAARQGQRAGSITLQLDRPDITQSCILLAAVRSCASQRPTASMTTATSNPINAPRRLPPSSDSLMPAWVPVAIAPHHDRLHGCVRSILQQSHNEMRAGSRLPLQFHCGRFRLAKHCSRRWSACAGRADERTASELRLSALQATTVGSCRRDQQLRLISLLITEKARDRLEAQRASDRSAMTAETVAKVLGTKVSGNDVLGNGWREQSERG